MQVLYFDTSAIVKRYDESEIGSTYVAYLFINPSSDLYLLSEISIVEINSALYRKSREGKITINNIRSGYEIGNYVGLDRHIGGWFR